MILIPEQISYLRQQRQKLIKSIATYQDYLKNKEIVSSDRVTHYFIGDGLTDEQFHWDRQNLHDVTEALKNSEYLIERNLDKIEIGTKFVIQFDDYPETETIILTDCVYGLTSDNRFVSTTSLFGKNVIGKKDGDSFSYDVASDRNGIEKRKVSGKIIEIKRDPDEYLHYIKERTKSHRTARSEQIKLRSLANDSSETAEKELASYQIITKSQKYLLELEEEKLSPKKDTSSISRLVVVRKLLKSPVISNPASDTIGIGTKFDALITDSDQTSLIQTYEMINCAVSNELEDAYVERISPFGQNIYGLKQNDTFEFRKKNQRYTGKIITIHPNKTNESEFDKGHQYKKKH